MAARTRVRPLERRDGSRGTVLMRASVSARNDGRRLDCLVRDVAPSGCRIVSSLVNDLPSRIWLTLEGISRPVEGRIVWRRGKQAGVEFDWGDDDGLLA